MQSPSVSVPAPAHLTQTPQTGPFYNQTPTTYPYSSHGSLQQHHAPQQHPAVQGAESTPNTAQHKQFPGDPAHQHPAPATASLYPYHPDSKGPAQVVIEKEPQQQIPMDYSTPLSDEEEKKRIRAERIAKAKQNTGKCLHTCGTVTLVTVKYSTIVCGVMIGIASCMLACIGVDTVIGGGGAGLTDAGFPTD